MATTYNEAQIAVVDGSGNVNVIYPITKANLVSVTEGKYGGSSNTTVLQTAISNLSNNLTASDNVPFRFGKDGDGKYGYIINEGGADTVIPFKSGGGSVVTVDGVQQDRNFDLSTEYSFNPDKLSSFVNNALPINISRNYSSVILNNEIHIFYSTDHYKLDSSSGAWVKVSTLPYNFSGSCAVVLNNEIHILGGYNATTSHYKYNSSTGSWTSVSTLPRAFQGDAAVISNGSINIFTGKYRYSYKPSEGYWTEQVNNPISTYTAVISDGYDIYMLNSSYLYCIKYYGSSWTKYGGTLPFDFSYGDAVLDYDGYIHILGGPYNTSTNHYKRQAVYDANWSSVSTLPISFNSGDAISINNNIYLMKGKELYKYNSSWKKIPRTVTLKDMKSISAVLPYPFVYGSAVVLNDEIHILGGRESGASTNHYKYNNSSWSEVSTLPRSFYGGGAVVCYNRIFIIASANIYMYYNSVWQNMHSLSFNYYGGGTVVLNNEIHILYSTYHYKYALIGDTLTEVSTLPYNFSYGSAVVYNNEIHILGGSGGKTNHYKWNGTSWSSVSTLPYDFWLGSAVVYNNEIHILGGQDNNSTKHYKWDGSSWTSVSTLPYEFYEGSAVVYNNEIYILGSYGNMDNWDKYARFNSSTSEWEFIGPNFYKE